MADWEFETIAKVPVITEGPAWDGRYLFFTEIDNNRIHRYDPETGEVTLWREDTNGCNGLMFDAEGRLYGCEGEGPARRIARYDEHETVTIVDNYQGKRLNSPNDLAFDAKGRLWFTDPGYWYLYGRVQIELDHHSVYRLDPQPDGGWTMHRVTYDTTMPNGLLVTPDMKTLYVAESKYGENNNRELRAYPINDDGSVGAYEVLHNFSPHRGIDGMCLDADGNIVATAGWRRSGPGPMIYVFAPNGRVLETHPIPVDRPTNCSWGDADLQTLYVTNYEGYLLRARTNRKGWLIYPPSGS